MSDNYGARCKRCDIREPACCGMCTVCVSELEAENAALKQELEFDHQEYKKFKAELEAEVAALKEAAQTKLDAENDVWENELLSLRIPAAETRNVKAHEALRALLEGKE